MPDITLYYWPIPFRGQFLRAILAHAGVEAEEPDSDAISRVMDADPASQPVPHMAPPLLVDHARDVAVAEMPAIALYLAERFGLMPEGPAARALAMKVVNDANDVLDEMTLDGGRQMWTAELWDDYLPRLRRWMRIWEEMARRGQVASSGYLFGAEPGLADLVTATLWGTMTDRLPPLRPVLEAEAPQTAALTDRLMATPALKALHEDGRRRFGEAWCGGQIEASLRQVLTAM